MYKPEKAHSMRTTMMHIIYGASTDDGHQGQDEVEKITR